MNIGFVVVLVWVAVATCRVAALESSSVHLQVLCRDEPLPAGWIVVDRRWSATRCGVGGPSDPNQQILAPLTGRNVGAVTVVCVHSPTPSGWRETDRYWHAVSGCRGEAAHSRVNVKTIQRVR